MLTFDGDLTTPSVFDGALLTSPTVTFDGKGEADTVLDGNLTSSDVFDGDIDISNTLDGQMGCIQKVVDFDTYDGDTEVTPSEEEQVLYTGGFYVSANIVVNPIPSNYGKITWNGSYLTVS